MTDLLSALLALAVVLLPLFLAWMLLVRHAVERPRPATTPLSTTLGHEKD